MPDVIDDIMKRAMQEGKFDDLPGAGRRLKPSDDAHTPEALRMAHKLLKDNDLAPAWIEEGKTLEKDYARLKAQQDSGALTPALRAEIARYNRAVLAHNLKLPPGIAHRRMIRVK
ncbi:MAG: DUF1992 domain-containing protein [Anaerolineae bacterium]|nr:DUF1992 domain-containing protein [Anaerolineae bacterium]NUQ06213.1 DUF1992 domain-containing protein [Anaerolineae bacterium]